MTNTQTNMLKPYKQGDLDPLCGIYSCINAIRWVCRETQPISPQRAHFMFYEAVEHLASRKKLKTVLINGMGTKTHIKLLNHLIAYVSDHHGTKLSALTVKPNALKSKDFGQDGALNGAYIIRLKGGIDHFTVISSLDAKRYFLIDSGQKKYIHRRSVCETMGSRPSRYRFAKNGLIHVSVV